MEPDRGIRKLGFKRWYERQLIESHLYLVTAFLCTILLAASLEEIDFSRPWQDSAKVIAIAFVAGLIALVTSRRFIELLFRAERYGDKSSCAQCGAYSKFNVLASGERADDGPYLRVQCRKCANEWTLP